MTIRKLMKFPVHHPCTMILVANLIWGASAPITKITLVEISPSTFLFLRMFMGTIILLPFAWVYRVKMTMHEQLFVFLSGFFGVFLNIILFYGGMPAIPSINAPMIGAIGPLMLALLARVLLKERLSSPKYIGMGLGFVGVLCISVLPILFPTATDVLGIQSVFGTSPLMGNIAMVLATLSGVLGVLFIKPITHIPGHIIAFWQFAISSAFAFPLALSEGISTQIHAIGFNSAIGIVYAGLLSSVVAYTLYNQGLHRIAASESSLFSYISPIAAVVVAVPLLHEYPSRWFIIGSILVAFGVWVAERRHNAKSAC